MTLNKILQNILFRVLPTMDNKDFPQRLNQMYMLSTHTHTIRTNNTKMSIVAVSGSWTMRAF